MGRSRVRALVALLAAVAACLTGCDSGVSDVRLRVAGGVEGGVYSDLSSVLADQMAARLGMPRPEVLTTSGSPDNLRKLVGGEADVAFSAADVADVAASRREGSRAPVALARLYNDYLHLVVRGGSGVQRAADLAGKRVSVGAEGSGVIVMANRVLQEAGLDGDEVVRHYLSLGDSIAAFQAGEVDAFFWSGGLPTDRVTTLARAETIRFVDLTDLLPGLLRKYPVYNASLIQTSTYGMSGAAVNTVSVPNYLMATDDLPERVAVAVLDVLFKSQPQLAQANRAAIAIDIRSAIETSPVPLHEGAVQYYRREKI